MKEIVRLINSYTDLFKGKEKILFFKDFIYLFIHERQRDRERETEREREAETQAETQAEGEAGSMQGTGCRSRSYDSRIMPWTKGRRQTAEPPRHPKREDSTE